MHTLDETIRRAIEATDYAEKLPLVSPERLAADQVADDAWKETAEFSGSEEVLKRAVEAALLETKLQLPDCQESDWVAVAHARERLPHDTLFQHRLATAFFVEMHNAWRKASFWQRKDVTARDRFPSSGHGFEQDYCEICEGTSDESS